MTVRLIAAAAVSAVLAGCWMTRGGIFPEDADEVHVGYFRNDTFYREFEFLLTEAVVSEILSRPGLRLSSRDEADVYLRGSITAVRQRVLSEDPERNPQENQVTVTVEFDVVDARTDEVRSTHKLTSRGDFTEVRGETIESARLEALGFLARDIVRVLESDF